MPTYYCDLGTDYADQTGADSSGNELYGVGGLQAAVRGTGAATALAAGDILYVKGTGILARLVNITIADTTNWLITHEVRNAVGAGDDWTGVICEVIDGTHILVELDSGKTLADVNFNDNVENTDAADTEVASAVVAPGWTIDTASGNDAGAPIRIIGVDASWVVTDTDFASLDGNNEVGNLLYNAGGHDDWFIENFEFDDPLNYCIYTVGHALRWHFLNCKFHDATYGVYSDGNYWQYCGFTACLFYSNTNHTRYLYDSRFTGCVFIGGGIALYTVSNIDVQWCVFHGQTTAAILWSGTNFISTVTSCVFDSCSTDAINAAGGLLILAGNRFTQNGDALDITTANVIDLYSVFLNNTNDDNGGATVWKGFKATADTRITSGDEGYQDKPNDKFLCGIGAAGYRTEFQIHVDHILRFCPGLPTMQLPRTGKSGGKQ